MANAITLTAGDQIVMKAGSASLTLNKNGDMVIEGVQIPVKASGDVVVKGQRILED